MKPVKNLFSQALIALIALSGCSESYINEDVSPQGTISLERITLGAPESSLREAVITFVKDPSALACAGGKTQYLSRDKTPAGGQYMVQCKDGSVFQITVKHDTPVAKDTALVEMKKLLPADIPPQSRVDEGTASETYYWGSDYNGELKLSPTAKPTGSPGVRDICVTNLIALQKSQKDLEAERAARKPLVEEAKTAKP